MGVGQTGPRHGQSMSRWALETGLVELFCVALFSWLFASVARPLWSGDTWPYALLGLLTLDVVLVQGGCYWLAAYRRLHTPRSRRRLSPALSLRGLQAMYAANVALLMVFPLLLAVGVATRWVETDLPGLIFGVALYLFAVGEFVHYFLWKINMRADERAAGRRRSRRVPARFRRELRQARAAAAHAEGR